MNLAQIARYVQTTSEDIFRDVNYIISEKSGTYSLEKDFGKTIITYLSSPDREMVRETITYEIMSEDILGRMKIFPPTLSKRDMVFRLRKKEDIITVSKNGGRLYTAFKLAESIYGTDKEARNLLEDLEGIADELHSEVSKTKKSLRKEVHDYLDNIKYE